MKKISHGMPQTKESTLDEIRARFRERQPLNLSAVEVECPWLLDGLFEPDHFVGWRATLEAAGVPPEQIAVRLSIIVRCEICGVWEDSQLATHLDRVHGLTGREYRALHPAAEIRCEEARATVMGSARGAPARVLMPHWESAWSWRYGLDRLHTFWRTGLPVNFNAIAQGEPGMATYLRKVFGSWDVALRSAGLDPDQQRKSAPREVFSREEIVAELIRRHRETPGRLAIRRAGAADTKTLMFAIFREFGTYEAGLRAAGIEPETSIPALADPILTARREELVEEIRGRVRKPVPYVLEEVHAFRQRAEPVVKAFYVSWANLAASLGCLERQIFHSPDHTGYDSPSAVVEALRERAKVGLTLRANELRSDNPSLLSMAEKHFASYAEALAAARVSREPRMISCRKYPTPESIVAELRRRRDQGLSTYAIDITAGDKLLHLWAIRYFGDFQRALRAARIRQRAFKPRDGFKQVRYPDAASVLAEIGARHRRGDAVTLREITKVVAEGGDKTLHLAACRFFKSWSAALPAAGIVASNKPGDGRKTRRRFWSGDDVLAAIRARRELGLSFRASAVSKVKRDGGDVALYTAARQYFPSWDDALREESGMR